MIVSYDYNILVWHFVTVEPFHSLNSNLSSKMEKEKEISKKKEISNQEKIDKRKEKC